MTDPRIVVLEQTVAYDGHFKIIRYRLRHRLFAGGMSRELTREVFERGHAVAVLPFDPARNQVVLIEQFRAGALGVVDDPWLLEPVAGIIESGESAPEVARREAAEEAGLELLDLVPACTYFASPGGSTETCQVFIGRVDAEGAGGIHGLVDEGEDIKVRVVDLDSALEGLGGERIHAATTVIALQWLALHRAELAQRWRLAAARVEASCPQASGPASDLSARDRRAASCVGRSRCSPALAALDTCSRSSGRASESRIDQPQVQLRWNPSDQAGAYADAAACSRTFGTSAHAARASRAGHRRVYGRSRAIWSVDACAHHGDQQREERRSRQPAEEHGP